MVQTDAGNYNFSFPLLEWIELIWETNTFLSQYLTTLKRRIHALRLSKCRING